MAALSMPVPSAPEQVNLEYSESDKTNFKTLIGLTQYFLTSQPPRLREAIHCLQATLSIESLPNVEKARCRLNLAKLLLQHTRNIGHARGQLEQANYDVPQDRDPTEDAVVKVQAQNTLAKNILRKALERSAQSTLINWHYRLIFQLSEAHAHDKEFQVAIDLLSMLGENIAEQNNHQYTRLLYMLSRCMLLLASKDLKKFEQALNLTESVKDQFIVSTTSVQRREIIKIYSGFLKVYYYIITGRPKTGKEDLKELQKSIQILMATPDEAVSQNDPEAFQWMSKDFLCILVYLVTVMHSMHSGFMDRALRHTEKALSLIEKTKAAGNENQLTMLFNLSLLEHAVMCRIVQGQGSQAINEVGKCCKICENDSKLKTLMKPVIHTLLGLYGMSMNLMADAEEHFKKALQLSNNQCDVYSLAALNLAIIYVRHGERKQAEFRLLLEGLDSDTVCRSKNIRSSYFYMMGLKTFFDSNYDDSKKFLRESLRIANTEDLTRMTACSLILLGHVVTSLSNPTEAASMIVPAMQVANKIPDVYLQLWAASLLKDVYRMLGDASHEQEGAQLHNMYTTQLLQGKGELHKTLTSKIRSFPSWSKRGAWTFEGFFLIVELNKDIG